MKLSEFKNKVIEKFGEGYWKEFTNSEAYKTYIASKEKQLELIKNKPFAIDYIKNPSEDLQLEAVKQNGYAIEYINNPSERVQIEAIKQYPFNIEYIHNPSEKLQLEAVKENPLAIIYIKNPTEKVIQEAIKGLNYSFDSEYMLRHIENDLKEG